MKRLTLGNHKTCLQPADEATFDLDRKTGDLVEVFEEINRPWLSIIEMLDAEPLH